MTDPTQRTRHRADRAPEEKAIDEWLEESGLYLRIPAPRSEHWRPRDRHEERRGKR